MEKGPPKAACCCRKDAVLNFALRRAFRSQRVVGATGFEPATSWSRTKRSSQAELRPEVS